MAFLINLLLSVYSDMIIIQFALCFRIGLMFKSLNVGDPTGESNESMAASLASGLSQISSTHCTPRLWESPNALALSLLHFRSHRHSDPLVEDLLHTVLPHPDFCPSEHPLLGDRFTTPSITALLRRPSSWKHSSMTARKRSELSAITSRRGGEVPK